MASKGEQAKAAGAVTDWAAQLNSVVNAARSASVAVGLGVYAPSGELNNPVTVADPDADHEREYQEFLTQRVADMSMEVNQAVRNAKRENLAVKLRVAGSLVAIPVDVTVRA